MPVNFPRQAAPRPWTTGELRRLREVCATGLTIDQIHARGLGRIPDFPEQCVGKDGL